VAALKALVIGMGVLIVAGTVTLVVLLVQRAGISPAARVGGVATEVRGVDVATEARGVDVATDARGADVATEARLGDVVLGAPEGSRIGGIAATAGAVAIWVVRPDGDRVVLLDAASGRRTGEVRLRP
jgi:hypothetical protein